MTVADKIRARRARTRKERYHSVPMSQLTCWQNIGWSYVSTDPVRFGYVKIKWLGPDPAIPVNFDPELADILRARGDLDDREGVPG